METTYFVAHANGIDRISDSPTVDAKSQLDAKYRERDENGHVSVILPNGDVHEYLAIQGTELGASLNASGCLLMSTGRVYGAHGWAYADGDINRGDGVADIMRKVARH